MITKPPLKPPAFKSFTANLPLRRIKATKDNAIICTISPQKLKVSELFANNNFLKYKLFPICSCAMFLPETAKMI